MIKDIKVFLYICRGTIAIGMVVYRIITLFFLFILLFIPNQEKEYFRIVGLISLLSLSLLPIFVRNVRKDILRKNPVTILFILFLIASAISTIFSIDQKRSIVDLLLYCFYFIIFTSIRSVFSNKKAKELVAGFLLLAVVILSFISLYNTLVFKYVNRTGEGVGFMWIYYGHNHLSAILLFVIPLAFYFLRKNWKNKFFRLILLPANCLLLFTMFFTFAFASMLSLGASFIIALLAFNSLNLAKKFVAGIGAVIAIGLFLFGTFWFPQKLGFVKAHIDSAVARSVYWQNAIDNFWQKPLTGSGLNTFRVINLQSPKKVKLGSYYAHNFFLQMLSDAGIFGFLASIGLIFTVIMQCIKTLSNKAHIIHNEHFLFVAFFVGIFASTLNTLVDFDWQLPTVLIVFWLFAGLFISGKE